MSFRSPCLRTRSSESPLRLVALSLCLVLAACSTPDPSGPAEETPSAVVEAPPDLEELDLAVREQYLELRDDLSESPPDGVEAGEAQGRVGQWFDVYGYPESAARHYESARRLDPENPRWPYHLGRLAVEAGRLDEAERRYQEASALAPDVAAPKARLGDLELRRQDLDGAERGFRAALAVEPDHAGSRFGLARVQMARGDLEEALRSLQSLSRQQPRASEVNYSLGLVWRRLGDDEKANGFLASVPEDNLDQVTLVFGSEWEEELARFDVGARTLTRRGVRAFRAGDRERAAVFLGRAVEADPEGAEKRINYGVALRELGLRREAAEQLRKGLERADEGTELAARAHLELARLWMDSGRGEAALRHLEATLAIDPASAPAHALAGRLRQRRGELEEALSHYADLRRLDGEAELVGFWQGALLLALDRPREALDILADQQGLASGRRAEDLLLARILATSFDPGLRDPARARATLAGAGPADVLFAETAAMVAAAEARFPEARAWQRAAIETLSDLSARASAHTARRRFVLYERDEPCRTPWEQGERLVRSPVRVPPDQTFLEEPR